MKTTLQAGMYESWEFWWEDGANPPICFSTTHPHPHSLYLIVGGQNLDLSPIHLIQQHGIWWWWLTT